MRVIEFAKLFALPIAFAIIGVLVMMVRIPIYYLNRKKMFFIDSGLFSYIFNCIAVYTLLSASVLYSAAILFVCMVGLIYYFI